MPGRFHGKNYGTVQFDSDEKEAKFAGELLEVAPHVSDEDTPVVMDFYEKAMHSHPALTTVVQTFVLVLLSDICAQIIRQVLNKGHQEPFDFVRLSAVGTWSIIFMGPSTYKYAYIQSFISFLY